MTYIKDNELRNDLIELLKFKTRNKIVKEIQDKGEKMHQYHLDRFLNGDDVKLSTLKKINAYIKSQK